MKTMPVAGFVSGTKKMKNNAPAATEARLGVPPLAVQAKLREMGIEAAYQLAGQTMAVNMMDSCAQEGVTAFTEKRKPVWTA